MHLAAEMLKAIAHPQRIAIMNLLAGNEPLTVTEIYTRLEIKQTVVSHHLRLLRDRGVVNAERDGKNILYSLKHEMFARILECIEKCAV